jgi:hypothetical protein
LKLFFEQDHRTTISLRMLSVLHTVPLKWQKKPRVISLEVQISGQEQTVVMDLPGGRINGCNIKIYLFLKLSTVFLKIVILLHHSFEL